MKIRTIFEKINFIATLIFISVSVTPILKYQTNEFFMITLVSILIFTILLLVMFNSSKINFNDKTIYQILFYLFLWFLYIFILRLLGHSSTLWNNIFIKPITFLPIILYYFYKKYMNVKYSKYIINFIIILSTINIIDNIRLLNIFPSASEYINYSYGKIYFDYNIGGTTFSFYVLLIILFSLINLLKNKNKLFFVPFIAGIIYVSISARAITFILMLIGIVSLIFMKFISQINQKTRFLVIFSVVFIIIGISISFETLTNLLSGIIENERLSQRILELNNIFDLSSSTEFLRFRLNSLSINTFLNSPIIGIGEHTFISVFDQFSIGVGKHSQILDLAAEYGIVGLILNFNILYLFFRNEFFTSKKIHFNFNIIVLILFISYSFLNNSFFTEIFILVLLFYPSYIRLNYEK